VAGYFNPELFILDSGMVSVLKAILSKLQIIWAILVLSAFVVKLYFDHVFEETK
jgi:hypothetical protein